MKANILRMKVVGLKADLESDDVLGDINDESDYQMKVNRMMGRGEAGLPLI